MTTKISYRELGNQHFKCQHFNEAIENYTKAIEIDPFNSLIYSNRALCYIKIQNYSSALQDSKTAFELDENNEKAWYRHSIASFHLNDLETALKSIKKAMELSSDPSIANFFHQIRNEMEKECSTKQMSEVRKGNVENSTDSQSSQLAHSTEISTENSEENSTENSTKKSIEKPMKNEVKENEEYKGDLTFKIWRKYVEENKYPKAFILQVLKQAKSILSKRPAVMEITPTKLRIVGDIHGQFCVLEKLYDEITELRLQSEMKEEKHFSYPLLFNGDIIDRGMRGVDYFIGILLLLLEHPNDVYINRGNHENCEMNETFGFKIEVMKKCGNDFYSHFSEIFEYLPVCHILRNTIFIVHGGLPKENINVRKAFISKKKEYLDDDIETGFLWADPQEKAGFSPSPRNVGHLFGPDVLLRFLTENKFKYVVRSHEVKMKGYEWDRTGKLLTVFSAPKYQQLNNVGAFVDVWFDDEEEVEIPHFTIVTFKDFDKRDLIL